MREVFNETTDLYLQMLRKAQEVEDPRLVGMIIERLNQNALYLIAADSGCVVIPFPMSIAQLEPHAETPRFWPRVAAAQIGYLVVFYALLVVGHSIFS